jgi:ABC-type transporter Mla subunit MlaD
MDATDDASRRWAARLCQLVAWSRELRQQGSESDAALEELPSASSQAELVFTGTRDLLNFAADQVDQTAEALRMIVELLDHVLEFRS